MAGLSDGGFIPNFVRNWGGNRSNNNDGGGGSNQNQRNDGNNNNQNNNNNNNGNNQNGNNNNNKNNNNNNNDSHLGIWDDNDDNNDANNKGNGGNNNNGNNNNNNSNNNPPPDPNKQFDDFISSLDLDAKVAPDILEKLQNGDMSVLPDILKSSAQQAVKASMLNMSKIINNRMEEIVERAVKKANTDRNTDGLVEYMHSELEFTKDPDLAPVAKSVLGRALKKGQSREEAVKTVRRYFEKTSTHFNKVTNAGGANRNNNGAPNGNRGFQNYEDSEDWLSFLRGDTEDN